MVPDVVVSDLRPEAATVHRSPFRSVELFSGAGGLALATQRAGFRHELLVERDADACRTLESNTALAADDGIEDWKVLCADARTVSLGPYGELDLIAGGAACQPFSIAGAHGGRNDSRNLLPEAIRLIREAAPRTFLIENVDGLLRPAFAPYFEYVKLQLQHPLVLRRRGEKWKTHHARLLNLTRNRGLRYRVTHARLNAADFGVPQVRMRVFIVGIRSDIDNHFRFPHKSHSLDQLLRDQWITGTYWERHELPRQHEVPVKWRPHVKHLGRAAPSTLLPWATVRDAIGTLPPPHDRAPELYPQHVARDGARAYKGHNGSDQDWPSKTIKAGNHGVPGGENMIRQGDGSFRYYTVREMARIQTFPDLWTFSGTWIAITKQLGNAVPVVLGQAVAESIAKCLGADSDVIE